MIRRVGHFPERDSEAQDSGGRFDGRQRYDECARKLEECRKNLVRLCRISGGMKEFNDEDIEKTAMDIIRSEEEEAKKIANELLHQNVLLNRLAQETDASNTSVQCRQDRSWATGSGGTKNNQLNRIVKEQNTNREPEYRQEPGKIGLRKTANAPKPCDTRKKTEESHQGPGGTESRGAMNSQTIHIRAGEAGRTDPVHIIITAVTGELLQASVESKSNTNITSSPKDFSAIAKNNADDSSCMIPFENEPTLSSSPINQQPAENQTFEEGNSELSPLGNDQGNFKCFCETSRGRLKGSQKSLKSEPTTPNGPPHWQQNLYQPNEPTFHQTPLDNFTEDSLVESAACTCPVKGGVRKKDLMPSNVAGPFENNELYQNPRRNGANMNDESCQGNYETFEPGESHLQLLKDLCHPSNYQHPPALQSPRHAGMEYDKSNCSNVRAKAKHQSNIAKEPVLSAQPATSNYKSRSKVKCPTSDGDTAILLAIAKAAINLSLKKQRGEEEDDDECDTGYPNLLETIFEK